MAETTLSPSTPFDPLREAAELRIKILDRPDGGKEFILPAWRNFGPKVAFSLICLVMTAGLGFIGFINFNVVNQLPGIVRWFFVNHTYYAMGIVGLIDLVLTIACLDMWLRSSRIVATVGQLQVVTHWLFIKRVNTIPASAILELRLANTTTVNTTRYFDIVVLTVGEGKSWLAKCFPATRKPDGSFTENDLKVFNTGGKKIAAATGIKGEAEAERLRSQLRAAVGINI